MLYFYSFSLTPLLFIEVPVPSKKSERSCICVLEVSIMPFSTIFLFDFGIVQTMCYFLFFISLFSNIILSFLFDFLFVDITVLELPSCCYF